MIAIASSFERVMLGWWVRNNENRTVYHTSHPAYLFPAAWSSAFAVFYQDVASADLRGTSIGVAAQEILRSSG